MAARNRRNPFYILLIPAGLAFVVTAFAYGIMSFQAANSVGLDAAKYAQHELYQWLRRHGDAAIVSELLVLAVFTVGAIAVDSWSSAEAASDKQFELPPAEPRK